MTEEDARAWLSACAGVSRETGERLESFAALLREENARQNLVSSASLDQLWTRHIVDSAQLALLAQEEPAEASWLDLGSGPGLPGLVLAIMLDQPVHLVEERKSRIAFLHRVKEALALNHCTVHGCKVQALDLEPVAIITARAFAPLPKLFSLAARFSTQKTLWLLPKGKSAQSELESVRGSWQGMFHVKQSITDAEAAIIVARGVRQAGRRAGKA